MRRGEQMVKKSFCVRLESDLVEQINDETKARAKAANVRISLSAIVTALVKERLAQIQEAGR
jgi:hypothetical protein